MECSLSDFLQGNPVKGISLFRNARTFPFKNHLRVRLARERRDWFELESVHVNF